MENNIKEPNEIYEKIGQLIWSIFPEDGLEAYFYAQIYNDSSERRFYWLDSNGDRAWHDFDNSPDEITYQILEQLKQLQKHKLFEKEPWSHCKVTLSDKGEFNIKFAYIPWEDSWPGLYMQGISELTEEEADDKYSIPKDEWEKRQILKK